METRPEVRGLTYTILTGQCDYRSGDEVCAFYNRVYHYWKDFWSGVLRGNGSAEELNLDSFNRPLITTLLHTENEIAGMHMYSVFDLRQDAHREHSYMQLSYPPHFLDFLRAGGRQRVLTMEYLTVSPQWRKSRIGFSLAEVIMSLGVKLFERLNLDAFITLARADVKVPQMLRKIQFESFGQDFVRHNTPCEAMSLPRSRVTPHPDSQIAAWVEHFWQKRSDLSAPLATVSEQEFQEGLQ